MSFAARVEEQQARRLVTRWLQANPAPFSIPMAKEIKKLETYSDAQGTPLFFIVHMKPTGFLIVSSDDEIEPIIAFSPDGEYDPSTNNPLEVLVSTDLHGRHAKLKEQKKPAGKQFGPSAKGKWNTFTESTNSSSGMEAGVSTISDLRVSPLVQSQWDQQNVSGLACYNYYTPPNASGSASNYPCGCVATAMAQLMRFHQHPVNGVGTTNFSITVDGATTNRSLRGGDGAGGPYVWASMPLVPNAPTVAQRQAIGALTADAGVTVHMSYKSGASTSDTRAAANAFRGVFGYSNAIRGWNGGANIGAGLDAMVNPNLDAGYPVLLGITGTPGGHAIVCDGYGYDNQTLYHHLNMGWSGADNVWYNLPTIETSNNGTFDTVYKCVFNVYVTGSGEIISGRVTDSSGSPVNGATVVATRTGGGVYSTTTSAKGIYALAKVPSASTYSIAVTKTGYNFASRTVSTGTSTDDSATSGNLWGIDFTSTLATYTLGVRTSGGSSPTIIDLSPSDINGINGVIDQADVHYQANQTVTLTAPSTVGTKVFSSWSGVDNQNGTTAYVTMSGNKTATAIYSDTSVSVTITSPTTSPTWTTASDKIFLHGTASSLVTNVAWTNTTTGNFGTATGTTSWGTSGIYLNAGANSIIVTARDSFGRTATDSITVTYDNSTKEVLIEAIASTFIMSGNTSKNFGASDMDVGYSDYVGEYNLRGLTQFTLDAVPPGSTIVSARIGLYQRMPTPTNDTPMTISLYKITQTWSQTTVNWGNQPSHTTTDSASLSVPNTRNTWNYWDVGPMVTSWWTGASANRGVKLISSQENSGANHIRSFGGITYTRQPQLRVTYSPEKELPVVTITTPTTASALYYTNATASIQMAGTSSDNYTVTNVAWNNSTIAQSGPATGTTSWIAIVPLTQGWNAVSVGATDSAGNLGTDAINVFYVVPDTTAPSVPAGVAAMTLSSSQARVTWGACTDTGGSGFKEYRLYRNGILRTNTQFLSFTDTTLAASSNYCYTVAAVDNAGNQSAPSSAACISTVPPARPSLALLPPPAANQFSFRFLGATGYAYILESSQDLKTWAYLASLEATNTPLTFTFTNSPGMQRNFYRAKFVP